MDNLNTNKTTKEINIPNQEPKDNHLTNPTTDSTDKEPQENILLEESLGIELELSSLYPYDQIQEEDLKVQKSKNIKKLKSKNDNEDIEQHTDTEKNSIENYSADNNSMQDLHYTPSGNESNVWEVRDDVFRKYKNTTFSNDDNIIIKSSNTLIPQSPQTESVQPIEPENITPPTVTPPPVITPVPPIAPPPVLPTPPTTPPTPPIITPTPPPVKPSPTPPIIQPKPALPTGKINIVFEDDRNNDGKLNFKEHFYKIYNNAGAVLNTRDFVQPNNKFGQDRELPGTPEGFYTRGILDELARTGEEKIYSPQNFYTEVIISKEEYPNALLSLNGINPQEGDIIKIKNHPLFSDGGFGKNIVYEVEDTLTDLHIQNGLAEVKVLPELSFYTEGWRALNNTNDAELILKDGSKIIIPLDGNKDPQVPAKYLQDDGSAKDSVYGIKFTINSFFGTSSVTILNEANNNTGINSFLKVPTKDVFHNLGRFGFTEDSEISIIDANTGEIKAHQKSSNINIRIELEDSVLSTDNTLVLKVEESSGKVQEIRHQLTDQDIANKYVKFNNINLEDNFARFLREKQDINKGGETKISATLVNSQGEQIHSNTEGSIASDTVAPHLGHSSNYVHSTETTPNRDNFFNSTYYYVFHNRKIDEKIIIDETMRAGFEKEDILKYRLNISDPSNKDLKYLIISEDIHTTANNSSNALDTASISLPVNPNISEDYHTKPMTSGNIRTFVQNITKQDIEQGFVDIELYVGKGHHSVRTFNIAGVDESGNSSAISLGGGNTNIRNGLAGGGHTFKVINLADKPEITNIDISKIDSNGDKIITAEELQKTDILRIKFDQKAIGNGVFDNGFDTKLTILIDGAEVPLEDEYGRPHYIFNIVPYKNESQPMPMPMPSPLLSPISSSTANASDLAPVPVPVPIPKPIPRPILPESNNLSENGSQIQTKSYNVEKVSEDTYRVEYNLDMGNMDSLLSKGKTIQFKIELIHKEGNYVSAPLLSEELALNDTRPELKFIKYLEDRKAGILDHTLYDSATVDLTKVSDISSKINSLDQINLRNNDILTLDAKSIILISNDNDDMTPLIDNHLKITGGSTNTLHLKGFRLIQPTDPEGMLSSDPIIGGNQIFFKEITDIDLSPIKNVFVEVDSNVNVIV